jgi:hypothetical protein
MRGGQSCVIIAAARVLQPLRQGQLDGLCGLYALVNAIRVAAAAHGWRDRVHAPALFRAGVAALEARGCLAEVIARGLDDATLMVLSRLLLAQAGSMLGRVLERRWIVSSDCRAFDSGRALQAIRREIRVGHPVLAVLSRTHCTVVVGFTPTRLMLFDSAGRRWIARCRCELDHDRATKRYRLSPATALAVRIL